MLKDQRANKCRGLYPFKIKKDKQILNVKLTIVQWNKYCLL